MRVVLCTQLQGHDRVCVRARMHSVALSCPTLCNPVNYSLPGSSVHGALQARLLDWVAISYSMGSSSPKD